ncbi:CMGC family protein kinase [Tritrichomonas foetus]|uniref:Mitogen-activated protein kinase n=1 Tax=Tritrichomonas foetus TaxID=1144522 RepID=A0A1J4K658_9EUKA|nr:CMGC family protein kinase [Tritrichomonas foetus]|eukprot:OHT06937.1 CMGC family protein kinase [Tritrichomonas foetus]
MTNQNLLQHQIIQILQAETQDRYNLMSVIGHGAYGIVVSAQNKITQQPVAIKRVERIFESVADGKRILREIRILSHLKHENITNLIDVSAIPDFSNFSALIVVLDLMETDLAHVIKNNPQLQPGHHRYFIYQVLRGLKYIHSANIIHRDLKPSNLLVNSDSSLKICDFGLARVAEQQEKTEFLSEYVATRWYRAPEVLLNYSSYGPAIDVWSVGCILAELMLRRPIFPGQNTYQQLEMINEVLGSPTDDDLRDCTNKKAYAFIKSLQQKPGIPFNHIFPNAPPDEVDLLSKMLTWDPTKRITVEQALEHVFLQELHDPFDEPIAFPLDDFEFENKEITMQDLKILMWNEVLKFHPEFLPQ